MDCTKATLDGSSTTLWRVLVYIEIDTHMHKKS